MQAPASAHITVADALALPELRRGLPEVIAGHESLGREIRWVHAGGGPQIGALLKGGELLLTNGMGVGERAADQRRYISDLAACEIAAVVIEPSARFKAVPRPLIEAAATRSLPLIELRRPVPFVAITEAILTAVVNGRYRLLQHGERIRDRLTSLMLEGGIPEVLHELARSVGNPVFLEDSAGRLLYQAGDDDPVAGWRAMHRAEDARTAVAGAGEAPVPVAGHDRPGRLVALPSNRPLDEFAEAALTHAASVIALGLMRERQDEELRARGRSDVLFELLGRRLPAAVARRRAEGAGFERPDGPLLPLAARLHGVSANAVDGDEPDLLTSELPRLLRDFEDALGALGLPVLVGVRVQHGQVLALLGLHDARDRTSVAGRAAERITEVLANRAGLSAVVVAGATASWASVGDALRQTTEAAAAAPALPVRPWHDATRLELESLLWLLRDRQELRAFIDRTIGPLIEHDARRKHRLLPTLEALCAHGARKAETARVLHLDRKALYERLARIEALLGVDLGDSQTLVTLHVALMARTQVQ